ncbi:MAG: transketolase family protein [Candidatus Anstonellales archaeon]
MELNQGMHLLDPLSPDLIHESTREGFGKALLELGNINKNVVVLTADLAESVRAHYFAKKYPERFFQCGVAEQNMACVSSGLAYEGKIPFMTSFGIFSPGRNWEQIRTAICYGEANVKIVSSHTGVTVGEDGATHQALEDIAIMRSLPKMRIFVPCDYEQTKKAVFEAAKIEGPVYIRCGREKMPVFTTEKTPFEPGKISVYKDGDDVTIFACGSMVHESLLAADILEREGISAAVLNVYDLVEIDQSCIEKYAKKCSLFVTVEEHQIKGGLGSAICEVASEIQPVRVKRIGMRMEFGETGRGLELLKHFGLCFENIVRTVKEELKRK